MKMAKNRALICSLMLIALHLLAPLCAAEEEIVKLGLEVKQVQSEDEAQRGNVPGVVLTSQEQLEGSALQSSSGQKKVAVRTVALLTFFMAAATGLGAVPFFFTNLQSKWAGICNGVASGVMLAASFDLIQEGQRFGSGGWVVFGILMGGLFILCSQKYLERFGEVSLMEVKGGDARKMVLVVAIMTLHSFGEGSGVGVSFAGPKGLSQGIIVTLAIAVHNIPEGLAVSMVLASRGVSARNAMLWSILTSMPQPLVAVPAFICAEAFAKFLPFCMGFAAGCMVWMVIAEIIPDSFKEAPPSQVASAATISVAFMETLSTLLENIDGTPRWQNSAALLGSLLFGLGPFLGGIILVLVSGSIRLPLTFLAATATGIAAVLAAWRPLQLWLSGKMSLWLLCSLFGCGHVIFYALTNLKPFKSFLKRNPQIEVIHSGSYPAITSLAKKAYLAAGAIFFHAFAEGLALGVAAPRAYGLGIHMLLPVSLHGLPRGAAVASAVHGATSSWRSALFSAAVTGLAGPIAAILAILAGLDYSGLDYWMVIACGTLLPAFGNQLFHRNGLQDFKVVVGLMVGFSFASVCLTSTRIVCLYTPYCNSAPEAVT